MLDPVATIPPPQVVKIGAVKPRRRKRQPDGRPTLSCSKMPSA